MGREIKFRKWDKEEGVMIDGDSLAFEEYAPISILLSQEGIMQYTGLTDKNSKEIYEGDIVRRDFEIGRVIFNEVSLGAEDYEIDDSGYFIGVVSFRPTEGYILNKCKKYSIEGDLVAKKSGVKIYANYAEVIGNIYENPELLEGNK